MKSDAGLPINWTCKGFVHCMFLSLLLILCADARNVAAQGFSSGSDGSDGAYAPTGSPGTVVVFDPSQFHGTQVSANVFNFTTISIPAGVTVLLSARLISGPVVWLAQGDVNIAGTVDLNGEDGYPRTTNAFLRVANAGGAGGYPGGLGGSAYQAALPGGGPGGGAAGAIGVHGSGGTFTGNQFLIPLIGGSGGGGGNSSGGGNEPAFESGGGAGGGAILIAGSTQISISGLITANGGNQGYPCCVYSGGGSGGAIRLVSNSITTPGSGIHIDASGANGYGVYSGGSGGIRVEAYALSVFGVGVAFSQSVPLPLLVQTTSPGVAKVISINGVAINPNPSIFPDITVNTTSAVPVVIQTQNIPTTATVRLTILNENNAPDTVIQAPPLGNCDQNNVCTTTVNVVFPVGASRGLTRVTWTP